VVSTISTSGGCMMLGSLAIALFKCQFAEQEVRDRMQMVVIRIKTLIMSESGVCRRYLEVENLIIVGGVLVQAKVNKEERPILVDLIARVHFLGVKSVPFDDVDGIVVDDVLDVALQSGEEEAHLYPCEHGEGKQGDHKPLNELPDELGLVHHFVTLSKNL
jgi:hypothetical protein